MCKIVIHGFGRIGRSLLKAALKSGLFVPAAVSDVSLWLIKEYEIIHI